MPKSQIIKDIVEDTVPLEKSLNRLYVLADVSAQSSVTLAEENDQLNRVIFNIDVPRHESPQEKLPSKIAWNIIVPIITCVLGAIIGAVVIAHFGL